MLYDLPVELLNHVVQFLPTAQSAANLSRCNHVLNKYFDEEGWKAFVKTRFPSMTVGRNWKAAAHSLTTYSRNLDRRAFLARYIEPANFIVKLPQRELETQWRRPRGQTMGFQPVIDSYEEATGSAWHARRQVLAWSAGAELVVRVKGLGGRQKADSRGTYSYQDHYEHHTRWFTYRPPRAMEGRDDITSLNVLNETYRSQASTSTDVEHVVLGTASGNLFLSHLELDRASSKTLGGVFDTNKRPVKSADVEATDQSLLAACLGDSDIALYKIPPFLYNVPDRHDIIQPVGEATVSEDASRSFRTWTSRFLNDELLAVGTGPSRTPIQIFNIIPSGIRQVPMRRMSVRETSHDTSVYSIEPLPSSIGTKGSSGTIFLSGAYDGAVRLHDLRSSENVVQTYYDSTDDGAIYSLQAIGRERFIAGGARHSMLKFWDLRMPGGRAYHYADTTNTAKSRIQPDVTRRSIADEGWNLFLNPRNDPSPRWAWRRSRATESPVYSLSSPSATSATLFAGVENQIVELDFISMLDKHPDPVFGRGVVRDQRGSVNVAKSWNPKHDVLNFAMYEQTGGGALKLRSQAGVGLYSGAVAGLDERWRDGG